MDDTITGGAGETYDRAIAKPSQSFSFSKVAFRRGRNF